MQASLSRVLAKLDSLSLRERVIVFVALSVFIVLGWYVALGEQAIQQNGRIQSELETAVAQLADFQARVAQQRQAGDNRIDPQARLTDLQLRSSSVEAMIQDYAAELISPTEMAQLLERVLQRRSTLQLRRLRNLGAEDLLPEDSPGQNRLYRHGLELELEGPYLAVLAYLEDLESLPWRLYWQVLEIDADEYPVNRVRIEVATLSLQEEWIGV